VKAIPHCSFCARPQGEVGLLFRSSVGAVPPCICDDCVAGYAVVVEADRRSRELAAGLIREWNAAVDNGRNIVVGSEAFLTQIVSKDRQDARPLALLLVAALSGGAGL